MSVEKTENDVEKIKSEVEKTENDVEKIKSECREDRE